LTGTRLAVIGNLLLIMLIVPLHGPMASAPVRIGETTLNEILNPTAAGYIANYTSLARSADHVIAYWTVPTVKPSSQGTSVLESVAIGSGDTIVQVGTSQLSHNGAVTYEAWYWVAPENGGNPAIIHQLDGKVGPGRIIGAEIKRGTGNNWALEIISKTLNSIPDSFQTQFTHTPGLPSAGWFVQPLQPDYPLANFGSVAFFLTNATIDGTESRLDQLQNSRLTLTDSSLQCNLAATGDIDPTNGDNFILSFLQSAGPCSPQKTSNAPSNLLIPLVIGSVIIAGVVILVVALVVVSTRKKSAPTGPVAWQNLVQTAAPPPVRLCSNCSSPLQPGGRFCDVCGKQIL